MKNVELKSKFKNKYVIRIAAGAVTIAVLGTGVGAYSVHAQKTAKTQEKTEESKTVDKEESEAVEKKLLKALSKDGKEAEEAGKEETVYVVAKADGTADNVIVSEWLKNKEGSDTLKDASDLKDIKNVKGDETFEQSGEEITWNAKGEDIYYQGITDKELPVTEKVTYYLDGKEMTPEEIAGKSGKVTIRFDYTNHEKTTQIVDGEEHEVYVPFTVMTGMILPEDYSNVEVTNGKVISDGSKKVVVGLAMPGIKESLGIDEDDLEEGLQIPEYVEVTADVENFSLDMTMSVIMNDLLGSTNLDEEFDLSGLEESMDTLSESSGKLVDGSRELSKGLGTLKSSIKEFAAGVNTLKSGIGSYTNGVSQLNSGLGELNHGVGTLKDGAGTLADGVGKISSSFSDEKGLINGAKAIKDGVNTLDKSLNTAMTEAEKKEVARKADKAVEATFQNGASKQIAAQAASQFEQTMKASKDAVGQQIGSQLSGSELYTTLADAVYNQKIFEAYQAQKAVIDAQIQAAAAAGQTLSITQVVEAAYQAQAGHTIRSEVEAGVTQQLNAAAGQIAEGVTNGIGQMGKDAMGASVADACKTAAKTAAESAAVSGAEGAKSTIASQIEKGGLVSGAKSLSEGVNKLYKEGIKPLKSGVDSMTANIPTLTEGVDKLAKGSTALAANSSALTQGADKLSGAASLLTEGAGKLETGSNELMDGMVKFDKEGIKKLTDAYAGDVKELLNKLTAVVKAGEDYQTFTKTADDTKGTVKFILRTEAVKTEE